MLKIELRGKDKVHISGYVNAVERFSAPIRDENGRKFVEKISAGTFERAIQNADDIGVMLNHEKPLTTVKKGGITLKEDRVGLFFDGDIDDGEVVERARNKELAGWSFGFRAINPKESASERAGVDYERTIDEMELLEVSIIDKRKLPCYPATSIMTRAEGERTIEIRAFEECEYSEENGKTEDKEELALRRRRLNLKSK